MSDNSETSTYDRRLVAIMFTDIVGYTSMMEKDENAAVEVIENHRRILEKYVKMHQGEVLQYYGDGSLSVFPSAIEAVDGALGIQKELTQVQIPLRIGIHLGDVKIKGEAIFGDGVNIASRIQALGIAGSIIISEAIHHLIRNQSTIKTVSLGSFSLKNVRQSIILYALSHDFLSVPDPKKLPERDRVATKKFNQLTLVGIMLVLLVFGYFITDYFISGTGSSLFNDKSIAVLPFANLSNDPEQEYFSDGITEDIINQLAKVESLKVKSRTTTEQYKNPTMTLPAIGQELGVSYILEGSVRKVENMVRVVAQLIDVNNDMHVWTETYDRELTEIFDIQSEIAVEIAEVLEARLTNEERRHINNKPQKKLQSSELTAYDYLLRARDIWRNWNDAQDLENALQLIENALEIEPGFARGYVLKGNILHYGMREYGVSTKVWIDQALELANKAIGIDSMLAGAYLLKGNILSGQDRDLEETFKNLKRAYYLEPGNPEVLESFGNIHLRLGNYEKGAAKIIQSIERQYSINDPEYYLRWGNIYGNINEYETAEKLYLKAISMAPGWLSPYYRIGMLYRYEGDLVASEENFSKALEIAPSDQQTIDALGWVNLQAGDLDDAARYWSMYQEIEQQFSDKTQYLPFRHRLGYILSVKGDANTGRSLMNEQRIRDLERHENRRGYGVWMDRGYFYDLAATNAYLGNKAEALAWLDSASQTGFMNTWYLENDPLFNTIRDEAEFVRIKNDYEARWQKRVSAFKKAISETKNLPDVIRITNEQKPNL